MSVQRATRAPDVVAEAVDHPVEQGVFSVRADVVRTGLEPVVDRKRREAIGRAIVDGYRRIPQDVDARVWSAAASSAMIGEEPW